jgi:hypothetical protein
VRRVEDVEVLGAEPHHLRREARAAHAEQDDLVGVDAGGELHELVDPLPHARRLVEPAEPLRLVTPGPDRGVALPDAFD